MIEQGQNKPDSLHMAADALVSAQLRRLNLPAQARILDLGCGVGAQLSLLRAAFGADCDLLGLDNDASVLQQAQGYDRLLYGDAHDLPLEDASCDAAVALAVLGACAEPRRVLRELRRVLKAQAPLCLLLSRYAWVQRMHWPRHVAQALGLAYRRALAAGAEPLAAEPDVLDGTELDLLDCGFTQVFARALCLEPLDDDELTRELCLLAWPRLRPMLAPFLAADVLAECDGTESELEQAALALVLVAH
jgi:SAM-dependent methyltransferase